MSPKKKKDNRGGKREGAGRPPGKADASRNVLKSIRVSKDVGDYLTEVGTRVVEDVIRRSKDFKDWKASK
ncbi:MAG: hypothetical protein AB8B50_16780 [Pirellulaceae bacterium]